MEISADDDYLRCKVCQELYSEEERKPIVMHCGHTLCLYCIKKMQTGNTVVCPFDKKKMTFVTCAELPVNWSILEVRRAKSKGADSKKKMCPTHKGEIQKFYCKTDKEMICQECMLTKHMGPFHEVVAASEQISKEQLAKSWQIIEEK